MIKIKRRIFIILVIICSYTLLFSYESALAKDSIAWLYKIDEAKKTAQESNKILMVVAITDWDESSKLLVKDVLSDKDFIELSRNFICLEVSILNKDFLKSIDVIKYPAILFFNLKEDSLEEIDRIEGYKETDYFIKEMKNALEGKDTLLSLREEVDKESFKSLSDKEKIDILKKLISKVTEQDKLYEIKDYYRRLLEIDKDNEKEYLEKIDYFRALTYIERKETGKAILLLKEINNEDSDFQLIRCCLIESDFDKVLSLIEDFLGKYPKDIKCPFLLDTAANFYFRQGRYKKGINILIKIIKDYPESYFSEDAQEAIDMMIAWPSRRQELFIDREIEDTVIIAPDIKTYLYYISLWTDKKIYPVLLEGSNLNDKFIKAFNPKEVKEVDSILLPGLVDEKLLYRTLLTSWSDEDILTFITEEVTKDNIKDYLKKKNFMPLGLVLTNPKDGEMPGGIALASARNQIIDTLPYTAKNEKSIDYNKMRDLREKITDIIKEWNYPYEGFLDGIDYITIAGDFPYTYRHNETPTPGRYSLDDALGRDEDDKRYAHLGRLAGDWNMSIYQAMCSIFLQPKDALFFNTYSHSGLWSEYKTEVAEKMISNVMEASNIEDKDATLERWNILTSANGNEYDLVFINSSGGPKNWSTSDGTGNVDDIPQSVPAIVVFTHSNSAADFYDEDTIAGRWLENGAYIYFGAVSEPYVQSFKNPYEVVSDLLFGCTFSKSLYRDSGPWSNPWRLIYIGDPMNSLAPLGIKENIGKENIGKNLLESKKNLDTISEESNRENR